MSRMPSISLALVCFCGLPNELDFLFGSLPETSEDLLFNNNMVLLGSSCFCLTWSHDYILYFFFLLSPPIYLIISVQFSCLAMSNSLRPFGRQRSRLSCPSPTLGACPNSCPSSKWCHPTVSFSVVPSSSCLQSLPASGSFLMSQFFTSGGQSIGALASTSVLPMNTWSSMCMITEWSKL